MPVPPPHLLLCEACGYPLPGLDEADTCPECGTLAEQSDPALRTGPLWHTRPGPGAWIDIAVALLTGPSAFFRILRIGGSNVMPRLFLLSVACLVGAGWALGEALWNDRPAPLAWALGMVAAKSVLLLSYLEAAGVTFFSWRRGWRIPFRLAERVVCYAGMGWIPAAAGIFLVVRVWHTGAMANVLRTWMPAGSPITAEAVVPLVLLANAGLLMMIFEAWVYVGVRQVRFANPPQRRRFSP